jgi:hypothetical protein
MKFLKAMKKIGFVLALLLLTNCKKDDDATTTDAITPSLTVTIISVQAHQATIGWTLEGGTGQALFRIVVAGAVIADGISQLEYTIGNLASETTYNGVVFAIQQNGDETFEEFTFTTTEVINTTNTIYNGNLSLTTQQEVDSLPYTEIRGTLFIGGSEINNLNGLASLELVNNLRIVGTSLETLDGLDNLSSTLNSQLSITLEDITLLTNISALQAISSQAKSLVITGNSNLTDFNGLSIAPIADLIKIEACPVGNLSFLSNMETADRVVLRTLTDFSANGTQGLNNVTSIRELIVSDVLGLENFSGLLSLETIQNLEIQNCPNLQSMNGLSSLTDIETIDIHNCTNLVSLAGLESLMHFRVLRFSNLNSLQNISALDNVVGEISTVELIGLPNLLSLTGLDGINLAARIELDDLDSLTNLQGLNGLTEVVTSFIVRDSDSFGSAEGLENLERVSTVFDPIIGFPAGTFGFFHLPQFSSFQGLNNISFIGELSIFDCPSLSTLDGLNTAQQSFNSGAWFGATENPSLVDYCALNLWASSNSFGGGGGTIGNAYNPSWSQIASETECSQ